MPATGSELGLDDPARKPLAEWARRDDAVAAIRIAMPAVDAIDEAIDDAIYAPYLERQRGELAARSRDRAVAIPPASTLPGAGLVQRDARAA